MRGQLVNVPNTGSLYFSALNAWHIPCGSAPSMKEIA
jgi:hypothetical protein